MSILSIIGAYYTIIFIIIRAHDTLSFLHIKTFFRLHFIHKQWVVGAKWRKLSYVSDGESTNLKMCAIITDKICLDNPGALGYPERPLARGSIRGCGGNLFV